MSNSHSALFSHIDLAHPVFVGPFLTHLPRSYTWAHCYIAVPNDHHCTQSPPGMVHTSYAARPPPLLRPSSFATRATCLLQRCYLTLTSTPSRTLHPNPSHKPYATKVLAKMKENGVTGDEASEPPVPPVPPVTGDEASEP